MLKSKSTQIVTVQDWDELVVSTYGRPYSFQQQDGCKERGLFYITIPESGCDYKAKSVTEEINGDDMGVSFSAWLSRDPKEWNGDPDDKSFLDMFWERNFYPEVQIVANDLHAKGLIEAGEYGIDIDW